MRRLAEQVAGAVIVLAGVLTVVPAAELPPKGGSHRTFRVPAAELPPKGGSHKSLLVTSGFSNSLVRSGFSYSLVASGFSRKITPITLRSVRVEPANQDGTMRVVIEANGALPE